MLHRHAKECIYMNLIYEFLIAKEFVNVIVPNTNEDKSLGTGTENHFYENLLFLLGDFASWTK